MKWDILQVVEALGSFIKLPKCCIKHSFALFNITHFQTAAFSQHSTAPQAPARAAPGHRVEQLMKTEQVQTNRAHKGSRLWRI